MNASADHEAYLRAALRAAADSLEPRVDGLQRIRARIQQPRPRAVVWLLTGWDEVRLRVPAAAQDACYRLAAEFRTARDRFAPAQAPGKHRSRAQGWLRPLAAMAAVMFIVAAGTYVAIDVSTAVSPSSSRLHPHPGQPGPGGHTSSPSPSPSRATPGSGSGTRHTSPSPASSPRATAQPSPSGSVPPSPKPSATPSDSSSPDSPAPTPSAT